MSHKSIPGCPDGLHCPAGLIWGFNRNVSGGVLGQHGLHGPFGTSVCAKALLCMRPSSLRLRSSRLSSPTCTPRLLLELFGEPTRAANCVAARTHPSSAPLPDPPGPERADASSNFGPPHQLTRPRTPRRRPSTSARLSLGWGAPGQGAKGCEAESPGPDY